MVKIRLSEKFLLSANPNYWIIEREGKKSWAEYDKNLYSLLEKYVRLEAKEADCKTIEEYKIFINTLCKKTKKLHDQLYCKNLIHKLKGVKIKKENSVIDEVGKNANK